MSAEYEGSRSAAERKDIMQKAKKNDSSNNDDDTLDDLAGSANNSIIGKVKSRVSSIIPSSLSKWFSPSTRNNDSLNGSLNLGSAKRRRRLEIEDDEEYDEDNRDRNENETLSKRDYKENLGNDKVNKDSGEEDTDNNSEEDFPKVRSVRSTKSEFVNEPPSKRSRISSDVSSVHDHPLIASTPAVSNNHRNTIRHSIGNVLLKPTPSFTISNFTETNVNTNALQTATSPFGTIFVPEVKPQDTLTNKMNMNEKQLDNVTGISSRRTLHLPSTSLAAKERDMSIEFSKFKNLGGDIPSANTSTNVTDVDTVNRDKQPPTFSDGKDGHNLNGNTSTVVSSKKQKLNGLELPEESNADAESSSESGEDCVGNNSELPNITNLGQRKTGLFNMSNINSQNGNKSRTSSFGNGINFYSHLEGRKSLFSGGTHSTESANLLNNSTLSLTSLNRRQFNASIYGSTSALSDSRLLNTFSPFYKGKTTYGGAAAYKKINSGAGSNRICNITPTIIRPTSSLSTLSSSNNSLIANTGATNALIGQSNNGPENTSAISSTAKRILDLINDFATPLSEAKKMAYSSVKANLQILPQAKTRLNETDLQASRAMRLSQVRTPYSRPVVTLQPTIKNTAVPPPVKELQVPSMSQLLQMKKLQSTTERSRQITMQNVDNATRTIVRSGEYKLPLANENNSVDKETSQVQQQQQQHTNKIKSKVRASGRVTASKNAENLGADEAPPPVNLPNIAFPLMQSVPKFDIDLLKPQTKPLDSIKSGINNHAKLPKSQMAIGNSPAVGSSANNGVVTKATSFKFNADSEKIDFSKGSNHIAEAKSTVDGDKAYTTGTKINFKFSAPLTFECFDANVSPKQNSNTITKKYTFSSPSALNFENIENVSHAQAKSEVQSGKTVVSELKTGSVLDALKKPLILPSTAKEITPSSNSGTNKATIGFSDPFKKSINNNWECSTCLIRNENDVDKCVACETLRAKPSYTPTLTSISKAPLSNDSLTLSAQFKKPLDEWECDVCMIRNKTQSDKCIACETVRKCAQGSSSLSAGKWQPNSFGEAFKPKANTWECPTCLINNKSDCSACIACQTNKPGSANEDSSKTCSTTKTINTTYKFGFNNVDSKPFGHLTAQPDSGFKSLAASQMSAKWECAACMTRNDAARNKCVCCEQAKPGISDFPDNGPKFTFGSSASSKFTFGFGASVNGTTTSDSGAVKTSVAGSNQKTEENKTKGLTFGEPQATIQPVSGGTGFTFGIKSTSVTSEKDVSSKSIENKDVADCGNNSTKTSTELYVSGFKFGTDSALENKDLSTKPNFQFGVPVTTSTSTVTSSPVVKFSFGVPVTNSVNAIGGEPKQQSNSNDSLNSKPATEGFSFGNSTTSAPQTTSGFSVGTSTTTIAKSTVTTTSTFTFGGSTSTTQTSQPSATTTPSVSTTTVKPMFSFGSNTTSTTQALESTPPSSIIATSTTTLSPFSKPTAGFSFGSGATGCASASLAAKPIFGSFSSASTTSEASATNTSAPSMANSTLSSVPKSIFGTFGESSLSAKTTTTSASPTSLSTAASSTNLFGSVSLNVASTISGESKPIASATMIFGSAGSGISTNKMTTGATQAPIASFVFGSSTSNATTQGPLSNTTTSGNIVAPATGWPKGGFAFGVSASNSGTQNTNETSKKVFGSFSSATAPSTTGASGSMFGNFVSSGTASGANSTFGSAAANGSAVKTSTMFGTNTSNTLPTTQTTQSLFGSGSTAPSAFGAPPTFGNAANSTSNSTPTFGGVSSATFGSFGSTASNASGDGASAPKKSEPAFNFGGNSSQIGSSSGFNFGMQAGAPAKPAFNFTASSAPAFNFTGSSSDAAKPFQFGTTPPAPVFNFNSGSVEATPNAPFQFNAGTAPASSNIFAPTPSATSAPGAMQARRKIRQPARRLPPR